MTIDDALRKGKMRLSPSSSTPRLDAEVLLAHALRLDRAQLLARMTDALGDADKSGFDALMDRRSLGEPVAYLTGHKEFYGLDLLITPAVLVPRPETESLVEACLGVLAIDDSGQLADIGTGSGAVLVAIAKNRPNLRVLGTDISANALQVAKANVDRHGLCDRVTLLQGHLLDPLDNLADKQMKVITANLPYVPPGEASPDVASWEPHVAVFGGGEDGTALIREFLNKAPAYLLPGGAVIMETAHSQGQLVSQLAQEAFPKAHVEVRKDLAGYDRIVMIVDASQRSG